MITLDKYNRKIKISSNIKKVNIKLKAQKKIK